MINTIYNALLLAGLYAMVLHTIANAHFTVYLSERDNECTSRLCYLMTSSVMSLTVCCIDKKHVWQTILVCYAACLWVPLPCYINNAAAIMHMCKLLLIACIKFVIYYISVSVVMVLSTLAARKISRK